MFSKNSSLNKGKLAMLKGIEPEAFGVFIVHIRVKKDWNESNVTTLLL